ncbi:MAG: hypothetical protein AUI11_13315 [Acidobacteria bacterium 13_2_20CM_2_66_4]|nr:MAG: hypothetical protein AUI11_13315 [Acidobacteria bacterium 13_2_20CM_2_66_4]
MFELSKATPGSDPKSKPLVPIDGGSGTSTPPQVFPPSEEKYARIGRRKISLEPAASCFGLLGLMAMNVSLCGPHSLDTSTFVSAIRDVTVDRRLSGPLFARKRNLSHQVGSCDELCASAVSARVRLIIRTTTVRIRVPSLFPETATAVPPSDRETDRDRPTSR